MSFQQTTKLLDNSYYSIGFPNLKFSELISRDNYLSQIEDYFNQGASIVFIEGEEDSGKTTICAQFVTKKVNESISIFFNPLNILDFKTEFFCSNVVYQIKNILAEEVNIESEKYFGIDEYQRYIFQLRKKCKKQNQKIYLILDGLDEKVKEDAGFIQELFTIVPFGQDLFKIIISGNKYDFLKCYSKLKSEEIKTVVLTGFVELEINKFLSLSEETPKYSKDLYKITKGFPGRLKTLKRLIENDKYSFDQITSSTTYQAWLEIDCDSIDLSSNIINAILSLISLSDKSFTIEEISNICEIDSKDVSTIIESLDVLEIRHKHLTFISLAHKKYFSNILRGNSKKVKDRLISYYASTDSVNSLIELPRLYLETNDYPKILDVLDENYSEKILEGTASLKIVNANLEIGLKASEKLNRYPEMWRYSIEASIVNELDDYLFGASEIQARISIRDFSGAISLAQSAILKVDRLKLLALIARSQKELYNNVDEDLVSLIEDLYKTTDLASIGDKIYDIVSDLIYGIPSLAIEIIERSSGNASEKNINDWIITKLSVAAIDSSIKEKEDIHTSKKVQAIQALNNPSVNKINKAISFLVGNYTAERVLTEVKKLSDSKERLRLLRLWLNNNRKNIMGVEDVINLALDELILTSSKTDITLDILKELSLQLPYLNEQAKLNLYRRFKQIETTLSDLILTKNKYIYQLNIFHAEYGLDKHQSIITLNKTISEIEQISDVLIKVESFCSVYCKLTILHDFDFSPKIKFLYSRILTLSSELFANTAAHFQLSETLLKTLGKINPVLCLKICDSINTRESRDKARLLVLDSYLNNSLRNVKLDLIKEIEKFLESRFSKRTLIVNVLERYADNQKLPSHIVKELLYFTNKESLFSSPNAKAYILVLGYRIINKNEYWKSKLSVAFKKKIYSHWRSIEADWEKIDFGFSFCSDISPLNLDFAKKFFKEAEKLKNESWFDSTLVAYTYLNSLNLVVRSFTALVLTENYTKKDEGIIDDLISRVPSQFDKLKIWTELAFFTHSIQKDSYTKDVLNKHIIPLIHDLTESKNDLSKNSEAFTLLYIYHPQLVTEYVEKQASDLIEDIYSDIADFYVTKRNPFEIYEDNEEDFDCSYADIKKAIGLLEYISKDNSIFYQIKNICKAVSKKRNDFGKTQVEDIVQNLIQIVDTKLPDKNNIKHDGYKILSMLKINLIKRNVDKGYWQTLINEAYAIPNKSDSILVMSVILEDTPFDKLQNGTTTKSTIFNYVLSELDKIHSYYEYIQRVLDVSEYMFNVNKTTWKEVVKKAFCLCDELKEGTECVQKQKRLIDSMYRLDPIFAKDLIKLVNGEKNNNKFKELLETHYETLEISKKIKNNKTLESHEKEKWKLVLDGLINALRSLNSEKVSPKKISEVSSFLTIGSKLSFHEVLPVYMYYLNNCLKTYSHKNLEGNVANLHRDNFKRVVESTNLIQILTNKRKTSNRYDRRFFLEDFSSNLPVRTGSREEAINYLHSWFSDQVDEYIIVADPYFKKEDLEIIKIISGINSNIPIEVLGSKDGLTSDIEIEYKKFWNRISDEIPPDVTFTFCWVPDQNNNTPFHDRWIISKNSGLRLGTSINSLGTNKESELSIMKQSEAQKVKDEILSDYLTRKKRMINNQKIIYKSFNI